MHETGGRENAAGGCAAESAAARLPLKALFRGFGVFPPPASRRFYLAARFIKRVQMRLSSAPRRKELSSEPAGLAKGRAEGRSAERAG